MKYEPDIHTTTRGCLAVDLIEWMRGRPQTLPPIMFLHLSDNLTVIEVADAQWYRSDNSIEVLTSEGEVLIFDANEELSLIKMKS